MIDTDKAFWNTQKSKSMFSYKTYDPLEQQDTSKHTSNLILALYYTQIFKINVYYLLKYLCVCGSVFSLDRLKI